MITIKIEWKVSCKEYYDNISCGGWVGGLRCTSIPSTIEDMMMKQSLRLAELSVYSGVLKKLSSAPFNENQFIKIQLKKKKITKKKATLGIRSTKLLRTTTAFYIIASTLSVHEINNI
jgi:hypothetical protein